MAPPRQGGPGSGPARPVPGTAGRLPPRSRAAAVQPALHGLDQALVEAGVPSGRDQLPRAGQVSGREGMSDGLGDIPVILVPLRGAAVKQGREPWFGPVKLVSQELAEQLVVSVPTGAWCPGGPGTGWLAPSPPRCAGIRCRRSPRRTAARTTGRAPKSAAGTSGPPPAGRPAPRPGGSPRSGGRRRRRPG